MMNRIIVGIFWYDLGEKTSSQEFDVFYIQKLYDIYGELLLRKVIRNFSTAILYKYKYKNDGYYPIDKNFTPLYEIINSNNKLISKQFRLKKLENILN